jgi:hypothetical protein
MTVLHLVSACCVAVDGDYECSAGFDSSPYPCQRPRLLAIDEDFDSGEGGYVHRQFIIGTFGRRNFFFDNAREHSFLVLLYPNIPYLTQNCFSNSLQFAGDAVRSYYNEFADHFPNPFVLPATVYLREDTFYAWQIFSFGEDQYVRASIVSVLDLN